MGTVSDQGKNNSVAPDTLVDNDAQRLSAGLPGADSSAEELLRHSGVDPDRLAIAELGNAFRISEQRLPPEVWRAIAGFCIWGGLNVLRGFGLSLSPWIDASLSLLAGFLLIQVACQALIGATERLAARMAWDNYVAATFTEIISTLPEIVTLAFIIPVSTQLAFTMVMVTIYVNALVFSVYSYFLPKDQHGKFLMPRPITEVGTQALIGGGALGIIIGIVMLTIRTDDSAKIQFGADDLVFISVLLLFIFAVYLYKLVSAYASEEQQVRKVLMLDEEEFDYRQILSYRRVLRRGWGVILVLLALGIAGSVVGGGSVAEFAELSVQSLQLNPVLTAMLLAGFGGMGEFVIIWNAYRKNEHGIALANAFGGMTQVLLLLLPLTLLGAVYYHQFHTSGDLNWFEFSDGSILLLAFLFPTFYTLTALLENDHTFDLMDTSVLGGIVILLIYLLVSHNGH